jgi:hypothetical protein
MYTYWALPSIGLQISKGEGFFNFSVYPRTFWDSTFEYAGNFSFQIFICSTLIIFTLQWTFKTLEVKTTLSNSPRIEDYCVHHQNYRADVPVWWPGLKNSPTVTQACLKRRLKWVPGAWGYSWATLSPGVINMEAWSFRLGAGITIQSFKKAIVTKPQKGRPGPGLGCRTV